MQVSLLTINVFFEYIFPDEISAPDLQQLGRIIDSVLLGFIFLLCLFVCLWSYDHMRVVILTVLCSSLLSLSCMHNANMRYSFQSELSICRICLPV